MKKYSNNNGADFAIASRYGGRSEKVRILGAGGITFGGETANAHAIDGFEQGNWTPSFSAGGHTVTQDNFAQFTRIKDQVFCVCYVSIGGTGNGQNLTLSGLPFPVATNAFGVGVSDMEYHFCRLTKC